MGRFRDTGADDTTDTEVDISPLIDCVFILLIFFIVTTTFVEESGITMETPQAAAQTASDENNTIVFELTEDGQVLYENTDIGVSGVRPLVTERLREKEVPVIVRADRLATTGRLVRIVDEARLAGAEKVSVSRR